jgi:hypothetical protein
MAVTHLNYLPDSRYFFATQQNSIGHGDFNPSYTCNNMAMQQSTHPCG